MRAVIIAVSINAPSFQKTSSPIPQKEQFCCIKNATISEAPSINQSYVQSLKDSNIPKLPNMKDDIMINVFINLYIISAFLKKSNNKTIPVSKITIDVLVLITAPTVQRKKAKNI